MPEISVIVPVYNGIPYIENCLSSIVNQSFQDFELIVINDGSNDRTKDVLQSFNIKYDNIKIINQENQGLYETRKRGLSIAKGKYISWLDADDFMGKDMLKKMYEIAEKNDSDLVICNYEFYPKKISTKEKWFREFKGVVDVDFVERNSQPWNKLVKRDLLEKLNIGDMFPSCFDEAYIKVLMNAKNVVTINDKLMYYRVSSDTMSSSYTNIAHYERFITASKNLLVVMNDMNEYWREYFEYRVIYYSLMSMLVAAFSKNKIKYNEIKESLFDFDNLFKQNKHIDHILNTNFGKLKAFVIKNMITYNYSMAKFVANIALT